MVMKRRSTTPVTFRTRAMKALVVSAVLVASYFSVTYFTTPASADEYDVKIAALQAKIDQYNARATELSKQSDSLKRQIAILENEQATIQAQIDESQAQYEKLTVGIKANEKKIVLQREALGQTLADLYVDDQTSPIEMLASSNNIADYVDTQAQRESLRDSMVQKIDDINAIKAELEKQKAEVERVLADQKSQKDALVVKKNEQNSLLADTQGQESAYQSLISSSQGEQQKLRDAQQAAIAARLAASTNGGGTITAGSSSKGGYPSNLANAPIDSLVDPWGMYNRECVSYTAWKVYQKNGYMPYWGGRGNAKQWPANADAAGIPRGSTPKVGSVGVIYAGQWGHVVWVESINSNGTINISQYNYNFGTGRGMYSEMYNVLPSAYDTYIYF